MPDPLIETGAQAIAAQLATITEANGYGVTVRSVIRPVSRRGLVSNPPQHLDVIFKQGTRFKPDEGEVLNRTDWVMPFEIGLILRPSDQDATPQDTYLNRFAADVEKCLLNGEADWAFDGRINWWLEGPEPIQGTEYDGGVLVLNVHYRHDYGTPEVNGD